MKRNPVGRKYIGILALAICAGVANGCNWDDSLYQTYVSNDTIVTCEGMSKILVDGFTCTPEGCADCNASELSKCQKFIDSGAFEYSICPREYAQCVDGVCQVSPCVAGQHLKNGACVDDTVQECGSAGNNCENRQGWKEGVCKEGVCKATACLEFSTLQDGECVLAECVGGFLYNHECHKSTVEQCGSISNNCAETVSGWADGNCENHICVPTECKPGYHLNNQADACVGDDNMNCGLIGYACHKGEVCVGGECRENCGLGEILCNHNNVMTCAEPKTNPKYCGIKSADDCGEEAFECAEGEVCVEGNCVQNSCPNTGDTLCYNYLSSQNECINVNADSSAHCGACNYACDAHRLLHATSNTCEAGKCLYTCDTGFVNVGVGQDEASVLCIDPLTDNQYCGAAEDSYGEDCTKKSGMVCVAGKCVYNSCTGNTTNPDLCDISGANVCKNIRSNDADHCGACNYKCSEHSVQNAQSDSCVGGKCSYTCINGYVNVGTGNTADTIECVDPKTDSKHCNATDSSKGKECAVGQVCVDGACLQNSCTDSSETLCSVNSVNQCINVSSTNVNHCGACNYKCSEHAIQNAVSSSCISGKCHYSCTGGYVNVALTAFADTIKCVDPKTDNSYCGATAALSPGKKCGDGQVCVDGQCVYNSCTNKSETLCSTTNGNQCINVNSDDKNHCGTCNYKCSEHAVQDAISSTCSSGKCEYTCSTGYVNVGDGKTADAIRCIDPKTNSDYCNATDSTKGTKCGAGMVCVDSKCVYNSCTNKSETLCSTTSGNQCINLNSDDKNHCGTCNYKCSDHAVQNATSDTCSAGKCQYSCIAGYVNVGNGNTADTIKCIDPKTNSDYCNATNTSKGTKCDSGQVCVDSKCVYNSCTNKSETLCFTTNGNQCINLSTGVVDNEKVNHCGACNYACEDHAIQNATSNKCVSGKCEYSCVAGYVNVGDGKTADTIKCIDPMTNSDYCNATNTSKGTHCESGQVCVEGKCVYNSCTNEGKTLCSTSDGNQCIDLNGDNEKHCGACNYVCASHVVANAAFSACSAGVCRYACTGDLVNIGLDNTAETIHCVDPKSIEYCGAKSNSNIGKNCDSIKNADKVTCNEGKCVVSLCSSGYHWNNNTSSSDDNVCVANTNNACALPKAPIDKIDVLDCTEKAEIGICKPDGKCYVSGCKGDYHIHTYAVDGNICEKDSPEHCGSENNSCMTEGVEKTNCVSKNCVVINCALNYHITADGTGCEINTVEDCGESHSKCDVQNAINTCTTAGKCEFTCDLNYHKTADGTGCEIDDKDHCGSHETSCLSTIVTDAECVINGTTKTCKATSCADGYHLNGNECEADDKTHCGSHETSCLSTIVTDAECVINGTTKTCKATSCADGYHLNGNECEADDKTHCGSHETSCLSTIVTDAECVINGTTKMCKATNCAENYHLYNDTCEKDTIEHCGVDRVVCEKAQNGTADCDNGTCMKSCNNTYLLDLCNGSCVDFQSDMNHCGDCDAKCDESVIPNGDKFACNKGICNVEICVDGYHVENNSCVQN